MICDRRLRLIRRISHGITLTIEPNTLFGSRPPVLPDDDAGISLIKYQLLTAAGYQQYETSAYAKPGYQCQHTRNYALWRLSGYCCGAHGKVPSRTAGSAHHQNPSPTRLYAGRYRESQRDVSDDDNL